MFFLLQIIEKLIQTALNHNETYHLTLKSTEEDRLWSWLIQQKLCHQGPWFFVFLQYPPQRWLYIGPHYPLLLSTQSNLQIPLSVNRSRWSALSRKGIY